MQSLTVAAVSMNSPLGQEQEVCAAIERYCRRAVDDGAELVLLPELVIHGHCAPDTWELAEAVPDGPSTRWLLDLAAKLNIVICAGLSEKENDLVFNTQVLVGPQGYIGKQRKLHMSRDEHLYYQGGRELPVFDIGKCRVGMIICYDNQFPEPARILALRGAEVLLMPHAARVHTWTDTAESIASARRASYELFVSSYAMRARENACFAVLADQAGKAGHIDTYPHDSPLQPHHAGGALIFAPDGTLLQAAQRETICDEMLIQTLDASLLHAERSKAGYTLRNRRPELYGELIRDQVLC